jgi:hypothetical protein
MGSSRVWAVGNFLLFIFMAATAIVTRAAASLVPVSGGEGYRHPSWVRAAAVTIFACLGVPLAVSAKLYSFSRHPVGLIHWMEEGLAAPVRSVPVQQYYSDFG